MTQFNDRTSTLTLLSTRRSGKPRDMVPPGPTEDELRRMIAIAARVPDHGKLAPWRFLIIADEARVKLADLFERAYRDENPGAPDYEIAGVREYALQAPKLVIVWSSPVVPSKIPLWEQQLSAGAACMNLLVAAHAMGYVGGWLTGWPAYSDAVREALGRRPEERIAGFIYIGTPGRPLEERPRPALEAVISVWRG